MDNTQDNGVNVCRAFGHEMSGSHAYSGWS